MILFFKFVYTIHNSRYNDSIRSCNFCDILILKKMPHLFQTRMVKLFFIFLFLPLAWCCKKDTPPNKPDNPPANPVQVSFSGLATTDKYFPTSEETLKIIFDPSKGNKALAGFGGDVYIYAGVITDKSTGAKDWKYLKSNSFTIPDAAVKMTRQVSGIYTFDLIPRSFFGVPIDEKILKIALLFRNADGSTVCRNEDGSDIYLPLYDKSTNNVRFAAPELQPTFVPLPSLKTISIGQEFTVTAASSKKANLVLSLNGISFATANNADAITGKATISQAGTQIFKITADGNVETSFTILANGTVQTAELPSGAKLGVTFSNNGTSATFALFAPDKSFVNVAGDFNNWVPTAGSFMKRTPDGNIWWTTIDGLDPNKEYAYQYWVDGTLKVADSYTEKVLDPYFDSGIPAANFANTGTYPTGKTTGIVSTFKTNTVAYNWQNTSFTKPEKNKLVIYELLLRDFLGSNNYKTLTDTLNYLTGLGVNAIELMPVNEFEGNSSWGYNPSFYFAPDKYYGSKTDLQKFIDVCHGKGIAVILDVVFNHSMSQSPMVQLYYDNVNNRPAPNSPWYNTEAPHKALSFGMDFNHESAATKNFVKDVLKFWMLQYKVDGFRFDFTKGFTQKVTTTLNDAGAYDAGRISILKDYNNYIQLINPGAFVILEHFCEDTEEKELAAAGMMLWNNLNYNFNEASMGWLENNKSDFSRIDYKTHGFTNAEGLVSYMESHDEERMMFKNLNYGNAVGSYSIKTLTTALKRQELCAAFFFMVPGPKMIWQFGELGYDISINQNDRTGEKPVLWQYNTDPARLALKNVYSKLINLKKNNSIFSTTGFTYNFSNAVKFLKLQEGANAVVVIGNFDANNQTANVDMGSAGIWYDVLNNNQAINFGSATYAATLAPGEYHIFSKSLLQ